MGKINFYQIKLQCKREKYEMRAKILISHAQWDYHSIKKWMKYIYKYHYILITSNKYLRYTFIDSIMSTRWQFLSFCDKKILSQSLQEVDKKYKNLLIFVCSKTKFYKTKQILYRNDEICLTGENINKYFHHLQNKWFLLVLLLPNMLAVIKHVK
jgi:hypothetical protein